MSTSNEIEWGEAYKQFAFLTAVPIFLIAWIYFMSEQGLFWGLAIGWLPAAIVAFVLCLVWPVLWFGLVAWLCVIVANVFGADTSHWNFMFVLPLGVAAFAALHLLAWRGRYVERRNKKRRTARNDAPQLVN